MCTRILATSGKLGLLVAALAVLRLGGAAAEEPANVNPAGGAAEQKAAAHAEHVLLKSDDLKWQEGPPSLPKGVQVAMLEGDLKQAGPFTMRAKMPADYKIPAHWHPADEHVTVLSGSLFMGMGDKLDETKGTELTAGGFGVMPTGVRHFAWTKGATVIQVHGIGPWGIIYVNAADDPRNQGTAK